MWAKKEGWSQKVGLREEPGRKTERINEGKLQTERGGGSEENKGGQEGEALGKSQGHLDDM